MKFVAEVKTDPADIGLIISAALIAAAIAALTNWVTRPRKKLPIGVKREYPAVVAVAPPRRINHPAVTIPPQPPRRIYNSRNGRRRGGYGNSPGGTRVQRGRCRRGICPVHGHSNIE